MLAHAVEEYVAVRRAAGFAFKCEGSHLKSFAAFSGARGEEYVRAPVAVEWAGLARRVPQRARRLGIVIRFTRYLRAEDARHELPPTVFGAEKPPRPVPYILSKDQIRHLVHAASRSGYRTLRRATYSTLFALLACTGLRVSEAIRLRLPDITLDGLVIRRSKFRKSRLVPLHDTARAGLDRYLQQRGPYAPAADHVFVSLRRKPLRLQDVETAFRTAARASGLPTGPGRARPTPRSLRHTFAVRALQTCPDGREAITRHMVALSTYLGHAKVAHTYWYLEAVPDLMTDIAAQCERFLTGGRI
ncbi:MAG: tyrosine-type recombinase/integrase [Alphaproteobacteria bacterium]